MAAESGRAALNQQRELLKQYFAVAETIKDYKDERVCKNFLAGLCPNDLFHNTKFALIPCGKVHDERLKKEYEEAASKGADHGYEINLERELDELVAKNDRDILRGLRRVEEEDGPSAGTVLRVDVDKLPELAEISKQIDDKLKEAEQAGEAGQVERSLKLTDEAEALRRTKTEMQARLVRDSRNAASGGISEKAAVSGNHQKLRVCDACGSFLSLLDSDERLADHFGGRIHLGWVAIRQTRERLRARKRRAPPPPPEPSGGERGSGGYGTALPPLLGRVSRLATATA